MDGKLVPWKEAKIHVLTHTLHYGLGVFEGIRIYETAKGPALFRMEDHTRRLFSGAKNAFMDMPFSQEQINQAIIETARRNEVQSGYVRPIAYYGYGKMGIDPQGAPVNVAISIWPWQLFSGRETVTTTVSSFMRIHPKTTFSDSKISGHYFNSIFATREAKKKGFDEAILLDINDNVIEGPGENIFVIKDKKIYTPLLGNILAGITRATAITIARDMGYQVTEKEISLEEAKQADELFFTGTAAEITGISHIDETKIGTGAIGTVTNEIRQAFLKAVQGRLQEYESWLTYLNE